MRNVYVYFSIGDDQKTKTNSAGKIGPLEHAWRRGPVFFLFFVKRNSFWSVLSSRKYSKFSPIKPIGHDQNFTLFIRVHEMHDSPTSLGKIVTKREFRRKTTPELSPGHFQQTKPDAPARRRNIEPKRVNA